MPPYLYGIYPRISQLVSHAGGTVTASRVSHQYDWDALGLSIGNSALLKRIGGQETKTGAETDFFDLQMRGRVTKVFWSLTWDTSGEFPKKQPAFIRAIFYWTEELGRHHSYGIYH